CGRFLPAYPRARGSLPERTPCGHKRGSFQGRTAPPRAIRGFTGLPIRIARRYNCGISGSNRCWRRSVSGFGTARTMNGTPMLAKWRDAFGNDPLMTLAVTAALIALATTPLAFAVLGRMQWFKARRGRTMQRPTFASL